MVQNILYGGEKKQVSELTSYSGLGAIPINSIPCDSSLPTPKAPHTTQNFTSGRGVSHIQCTLALKPANLILRVIFLKPSLLVPKLTLHWLPESSYQERRRWVQTHQLSWRKAPSSCIAGKTIDHDRLHPTAQSPFCERKSTHCRNDLTLAFLLHFQASMPSRVPAAVLAPVTCHSPHTQLRFWWLFPLFTPL